MGKTWTQIQKELEEKAKKQKELAQQTKANVDAWLKPLKEIKNENPNMEEIETETDASDIRRKESKMMLSNLLKDYEKADIVDPDLLAIMNDIRRYTAMNITATSFEGGTYKLESELVSRITAGLENFQKKLDERFLNEEGENLDLYEAQTITANLYSYFDGMRSGDLIVPKKEDAPDAVFIDGVVKNRPKSETFVFDTKHSNDPLFSHEISANDISQGGLGDCYLLSSLSSIVSTHPEAIRDAIVDNNDGTATVRFYSRNEDNSFTPVYVTVEKVVPSGLRNDSQYSSDSLWVQTFERAFAASGLYQQDTSHPYVKPVPDDVDKIYDELNAKVKNGYKLTQDDLRNYPWIVNKNLELHKWEPSYKGITGGNASYIIQTIMGPGYSVGGDLLFDPNHLKKDDFVDSDTGAIDVVSIYRINLIKSYITFFNDTQKVLKSDERITLDDQEDLFREARTNPEFVKQAFYYMIIGEKPTLIDGKMDYSRPDVQVVSDTIDKVEALIKSQNFTKKIDIERYFGTNEFDDDLDAKPEFDEKFAEIVAEMDKRGVKTMTKAVVGAEPEEYNLSHALKSNAYIFQEAIRSFELHTEVDIANRPIFPEKYGDDALRLFKQIEKNFSEHKPMCCGTFQQVKDESFVKNHAYSLVAPIRKNIDGREQLFVRVRNPWGDHTREYFKEDGVWKGRSGPDGNGYMDLELNDFMNNFNNVYLNGPTKAEREVMKTAELKAHEQEEKALQEKQDVVEVNKEDDIAKNFVSELFEEERIKSTGEDSEIELKGQYLNALSNIKNTLRLTDGKVQVGSDEYFTMHEKLNSLFEELSKSGFDKEAVQQKAEAYCQSTAEYLQHADDVFRIGNRRKNRVEISKQGLLIGNMLKAGFKDPQTQIKDIKTGKQFDSYVDAARKEMAIQKLQTKLENGLIGMKDGQSAAKNIALIVYTEKLKQSYKDITLKQVNNMLSEKSQNQVFKELKPKMEELFIAKYGDKAPEKAKQLLSSAVKTGKLPEELKETLGTIFDKAKEKDQIKVEKHAEKGLIH